MVALIAIMFVASAAKEPSGVFEKRSSRGSLGISDDEFDVVFRAAANVPSHVRGRRTDQGMSHNDAYDPQRVLRIHAADHSLKFGPHRLTASAESHAECFVATVILPIWDPRSPGGGYWWLGVKWAHRDGGNVIGHGGFVRNAFSQWPYNAAGDPAPWSQRRPVHPPPARPPAFLHFLTVIVRSTRVVSLPMNGCRELKMAESSTSCVIWAARAVPTGV